jgi:hypothetical protein
MRFRAKSKAEQALEILVIFRLKMSVVPYVAHTFKDRLTLFIHFTLLFCSAASLNLGPEAGYPD